MLSTIKEADSFDLYQLLNPPIEKYSENSAIHIISN
jgi:hypothetical protein